jgi:flagellar hook-associated protein 1 FlgK
MSGLLSMLSMAARSLDAQRFGLDVVGQNIANVNTEGYTKRVTELAAVPGADRWSAGEGVAIVGARPMRDRLIDRRVREEYASAQREGTVSAHLSVVEVAVGTAGASLDAALDDFFDAFGTLADMPTSATARQEVVLQGQALGDAFRDVATRFEASRRDVDLQVRATVGQINELTERIARLNVKLGGTSPLSPEGAGLRDEINRAVEQLAGYLDINVIERESGGYDIDFAGGHPLVIGEHSYAVDVTEDAAGYAQVTSRGDVVTGQIQSGTLSGLLHVRDTSLPGYQTALDRMAADVVSAVNTAHWAGFDLNGVAGIDFFQPVALAGAASAVVVSAPLSAAGGTALVAASGSAAAVGDNAAARVLAGLRSQPIASGGTATATQAWAQLVYSVGRDRAAANHAESTQTEVLRQIRNLQDTVSGVSLDEEAADLIRFQRAYEANARFFTTVDEALQTLLNMVR